MKETVPWRPKTLVLIFFFLSLSSQTTPARPLNPLKDEAQGYDLPSVGKATSALTRSASQSLSCAFSSLCLSLADAKLLQQHRPHLQDVLRRCAEAPGCPLLARHHRQGRQGRLHLAWLSRTTPRLHFAALRCIAQRPSLLYPQVLAQVGEGNRKDIRNAVEAAHKAFPGWGKRAAHNRAQIVYYMAENLEVRREEFAKRIASMTGQSMEDGLKEVRSAGGGVRGRNVCLTPPLSGRVPFFFFWFHRSSRRLPFLAGRRLHRAPLPLRRLRRQVRR